MAKTQAKQFVVCIDNEGYPVSLEIGKVYRTLPGHTGVPNWIRVVDESGEDYLFAATRFVPIEVPAAVKASLLKAS